MCAEYQFPSSSAKGQTDSLRADSGPPLGLTSNKRLQNHTLFKKKKPFLFRFNWDLVAAAPAGLTRWHSRLEPLTHPGSLAVDLDPAEGDREEDPLLVLAFGARRGSHSLQGD